MNNNEENPQMKGYEVHNNESNSNNSLAITGFILSFFIPLAGLIVSIFGLRKAKEMHNNGKGFAIAGIVISSIFIGFGLLFTLIFILIFVGSYSLIENTVDYVDDFQDNYTDSYMCDSAYQCELEDDGMYSCKYENENGEEIEIKCSTNNNEFSLESAIIGDWKPFLINKNGDNLTPSEYYNDNIDRFIRFAEYNFKDYTDISGDETSILGTYEIVDNRVILTYYDGKIKYMDIDLFGESNINLSLQEDDATIQFSLSSESYYE